MRLAEAPQPWMQHAACRDVGPATFYDWEGRSGPRKRGAVTIALRYCGTCIVRPACLRYALTELAPDQDHGIWGGTTPEERQQLRRRTA